MKFTRSTLYRLVAAAMLTASGVAALGVAVAAGNHAGDHGHGHGDGGEEMVQVGREPAPAETSLRTPLIEGEIKKIDLDNGKVTIKHGDIVHLDMPGMTMVFTVQDKRMLSNLKPGNKVKFMVANEGGKMRVTDIQPLQ